MKNLLNLIYYTVYLHLKKEEHSKSLYFTAKLYFLLGLFLLYIVPIVLLAILFLGENADIIPTTRIGLFLFMLPFYLLLSYFTMDYKTMVNHEFSDKELERGNNWLGMLVLIGAVFSMVSMVVYNVLKPN